MFLDNFHDLKMENRFRHLSESLNKDFGIDVSIYEDLSKDELQLFASDLATKKANLFSESNFNEHVHNIEYVRTSLLLEAIKIILREIFPKRSKRRQVKEVEIDETLNYKIHMPTSVAVDHDLEEDRERPDLYWRRHQWEAEKDQENHPVSVMDASPAGEAYSTSASPIEDGHVEPYAQNVEPDPTPTKEDEPDAGIYVAVMDPNRFLGDKETQIMSIAPTVTSENETSVLTRKVSPIMVDAVNEETLEGEIEMVKTKNQNGLVEGLGTLLEGELERAEIVLATKDLVMRLQKMIEDLGNMGTDDIMPLVDGLRNNFTPQTAEKFSQEAEQHIQNAANAIQSFKDALDMESQRLEGRISDEDSETPVNDMTMAGDSAMGAMDQGLGDDLGDMGDELGAEEALGSDLLGGDEANASEEPLGRAKKEGTVITIAGKKVKLSEKQVEALIQTVLIKRKLAALVEASKPKTVLITVDGRKIRLTEKQIKSLLFAKNFNKIVESKKANTVKLSESQAKMLWTAKQVTDKIRNLIGENPRNLSLFDIVESKPSAGLSKKKKSAVVKKAKKGGDIGKKGKGFKKVAAAAKKSGAKDPEAVAAAAMWKNIPR